MRLLSVDDEVDFKLSRDLRESIPPYAILSHNWDSEEHEVLFEDLENGQYKSKRGFAKLDFCARQAKQDGLKYFWIDTCCIGRSDPHERPFAINEMFGWYQRAAKCYVFLSDVSIGPLSKSKWFTRGWTLPELLAPKCVEFFTQHGRFLGTKQSLAAEIHRRTGIPINAIRGDDLRSFSVRERMSWVGDRETTRPEDKAYCMLGIFDVSLTIRYGGPNDAPDRLVKAISRWIEKHELKDLVDFLYPSSASSGHGDPCHYRSPARGKADEHMSPQGACSDRDFYRRTFVLEPTLHHLESPLESWISRLPNILRNDRQRKITESAREETVLQRGVTF